MKESCNPCCGYVIDTAGQFPTCAETIPNDGDFVLCLNCGAILVFVDANRNVKRIARLKDLQEMTHQQMKMVYAAQRYIRKRGPLKSLN